MAELGERSVDDVLAACGRIRESNILVRTFKAFTLEPTRRVHPTWNFGALGMVNTKGQFTKFPFTASIKGLEGDRTMLRVGQVDMMETTDWDWDENFDKLAFMALSGVFNKRGELINQGTTWESWRYDVEILPIPRLGRGMSERVVLESMDAVFRSYLLNLYNTTLGLKPRTFFPPIEALKSRAGVVQVERN